MFRYLGIDYGDKRIGIAISDEEGHFAFPKTIIQNHPTAHERRDFKENINIYAYAIEEIKKIISLEPRSKIEAVVVGLPQNFSSQDTEQTKKVRAFVEVLKKEIDAEIIFENEILTSRQIEKTGASSKAMIDASSAALILQGYLDRKNKPA